MSAHRAALESVWGPLEPLTGLDSGGAILRGGPTPQRPWFTWTTARLRPTVDGLEIVTYCGDEALWPGGLLAKLATLADVPGVLQPHQVLDLDGPVDGEASGLTSVFLLPPYFEPEPLWTAPEPEVGWLLWAAPITAAEREYATLAGAEALEQAMFAAALQPGPVLDRGSLV